MTNKVIITGGYDENSKMGSTRVTEYNNDGFVADWPSLDTGRQDHGCGHFVNTSNQVVGQHKNIAFCAHDDHIHHHVRCTWWQEGRLAPLSLTPLSS